GGLAELWNADPSLVRIVWALLVILTGGIALLVYIVMAIVVPEDDGSSVAGQAIAWGQSQGTPGARSAATAPGIPADLGTLPPQPAAGLPRSPREARTMRRAARREARQAGRASDGRTGAMIVGALFILVGVWYLVREFLPTIDFDWFWPLVLVGIGVLVLVLAVRPRDDDARPGGPTA
ncbi:MAG: PspC domain-containing protein, partial [Candidatus Limnocylindrales bacterium]